ncbi:MAG: OprO/OprP family phosphate-selective porin [Gammaproteobacteria bacterium]|nr:OprO/OprP family phosphate-selective porin [Gammaproteobacteria bacterium]MCH9744126.1 OprO/OprP family phosphate-selective porin [Gammaproteobacteria bacterium]
MKKRSLIVGVLGVTTLASVQVLADQQLPQTKVPQQKMVTASDNDSLNTSADVGMPGNANAVRPIQLGKKLGLKNSSKIKINGFMSAGAARTTSPVAYGVVQHGEVKNTTNYNALSLIGLQVSANLSPSISVATQLVSNGDNTNGNSAYSVNADYAYLRYQLNNNLQVRAGRFRLPVFMYSETLEVGYSYPWVFLPNEVYRIVPFNNLNGANFIWKGGLGTGGWTYSLEPYLGASTSQFDLYMGSASAITSGTTASFDENDMYGAVVSVGNSHVTFRGTYARLTLSGNAENSAKTQILSPQHDYYYAGGVKFDSHNFVVAGEYAHRETPAPLASLTGYYAMLGYRIGKLLPTLTYAHLETTNTSALSTSDELPQDQESFSLDSAYYISSNFMAKIGISDIRPLSGTRGLFNTTTPGLLKKNIWMYCASVNAVF